MWWPLPSMKPSTIIFPEDKEMRSIDRKTNRRTTTLIPSWAMAYVLLDLDPTTQVNCCINSLHGLNSSHFLPALIYLVSITFSFIKLICFYPIFNNVHHVSTLTHHTPRSWLIYAPIEFNGAQLHQYLSTAHCFNAILNKLRNEMSLCQCNKVVTYTVNLLVWW